MRLQYNLSRIARVGLFICLNVLIGNGFVYANPRPISVSGVKLEVLYDASDASEELASARIQNNTTEPIDVFQSSLAIYMQRAMPAGEAFYPLTETSCGIGRVNARREFVTNSLGETVEMVQPTSIPSVTAAPTPQSDVITLSPGETRSLSGQFVTNPMCDRFIPKTMAKIYATVRWNRVGEDAIHTTASRVKDIIR